MREGFRVIHFNRDAPEEASREPTSPAPPEAHREPTPLAPWSTWLAGDYRPCRTAERFRAELVQVTGRAAVLLHLTDLEGQLQSGELDKWLDEGTVDEHSRPSRVILVYSGMWTGSGDHSSQVVPRLAATHFPKRWNTVPASSLASSACPVAWLGHPYSYLLLERLCLPFEMWRDQAAGQLLGASKGTPVISYSRGAAEAPFLDNLIRQLLRHTLLKETLRAGSNNPRQRTQVERQQLIHSCGDVLWLLEGVAESLNWNRSWTLIVCVRKQLERLMLCPDVNLDDKTAPENRDSWQNVIDGIQACIDEAQEEG